MKKIILLFLISFISIQSIYACAWTYNNPKPAGLNCKTGSSYLGSIHINIQADIIGDLYVRCEQLVNGAWINKGETKLTYLNSNEGFTFETLEKGTYQLVCRQQFIVDICTDVHPFTIDYTTEGCFPPTVQGGITPASSPLCNDGSVYLSNGDTKGNLHSGANTVTGDYSCYCGTLPYSINVNVPVNACNFGFSAIVTGPIQNCSPGSLLITTSNAGCATDYDISVKDHNGSAVFSKNIAAADLPYKITLPLGGHYTVNMKANSPYGQCTASKEVDMPLQSLNFYQVTYTPTNATKHGFSNGSIIASPNNDSNAVYLHYWPVPYQNSYSYYLYDVSWNLLNNGQGTTGFTFTGLAAGTYNVLTIGNRYDARFCFVPQIKVITITEPACSMAVTATSSTIQNCSANVTGNVTNFSGTVQLNLTRKSTGALVATTTTTNGIYIFTGLNNATYKVTATDTFACSASATITVTNQFCPVPTGLTFVKTTNNKGTVSWLPIDCSLGYNFQYRQKYPTSAWVTYTLNGPSSTSKVLTGLFPGTVYEYQVRSKCTNSSYSAYSNIDTFCTVCPSGFESSVAASASSSLKKEENNTEIILKIHPNPAKDLVYLTFSGAVEEKGSVAIYDATGKTVLMQNNRSIHNNLSIDVSGLGSGAYLMAVLVNNKRMTAKLIIGK